MAKITLEQVMESLIAEDTATAETMLHDWFVQQSKEIVESFEDEVVESEEVVEGDELEEGITVSIAQDETDSDIEEAFGDEESDDAGEEAGDEEGDEVEGEFGSDDEEVVGGVEGDEAEGSVDDRVDDLEAQLADLKAEFEALMGAEEVEGEEELAGDEDLGGELAGDEAGEFGSEETTEETFTFESEEVSEDEELEESEEELSEDEDFDDLNEGWELEPVADPKLAGNKEVGDGGTLVVNDKSTLPSRKGADRVGGNAVEIKSKNHKGYDREASPAVQAKPLLKNQVKNAKSDLTGVSKEGDKSALLNKKDGFGSDSPKSPIGAGATDLRGSDLKRK